MIVKFIIIFTFCYVVRIVISEEYSIKQDIYLTFQAIKNGKYKVYDFEFTDYGYKFSIDVSKILSIDDLKNKQSFIETSLKHPVKIDFDYSDINIHVFEKFIDLEYQKIPLDNHKILLGYDYLHVPIVADMVKFPHILISGLGGQGKTKMLNIIIRNLDNADFIVINGFVRDFDKSIKNIIGLDKIRLFFDGLLNDLYYHKKPFYILIDELLGIQDKDINNKIQKILSFGRHYNIYIIGVAQISLKEDIKYKSFFNTRVSFRQIEDSSYKVTLNTTVTSGLLQQREFYCVMDRLYKGKTYKI